MSSTTRMQRKYDHRLRDLIRSTGDINHATERGIPRSTARGWLTGTPREVVSVDEVGLDVVKLQQEVLALRRRLERLIALLRIVISCGSSPDSLSPASGFPIEPGSSLCCEPSIGHIPSFRSGSCCASSGCPTPDIMRGSRRGNAVSTTSRPAHDPRRSNSRPLK